MCLILRSADFPHAYALLIWSKIVVAFMPPSTLLFVYGTLKRGYTNFERYLSLAEAHGGAVFVCHAETVDAFPLVVRPVEMAPATCGPVLMDLPGTGHQIAGEIYRIDERTLKAMDLLEGVGRGHYYKRVVSLSVLTPPDGAVCGEASDWLVGQRLECISYFFPSKQELLALQYEPCYSDEHHNRYRPGPIRDDILQLCERALPPHGLQTPHACAVMTHVLRLLPGDDLLRKLRDFANEKGLKAAVVLSCVGSLGHTMLRPAGLPTPKIFDGKYEIVSLTGTLSSGGHHLHLAISDADCQTFGGHVLEGCIVRTTAEIALGVVDGIAFSRPHDPRTGYDELSIDRLCD